MRIRGEVRVWQSSWQTFLDRHPAWAEGMPQHEPLYWLPQAVIDGLARPVASADSRQRNRPALLTRAEAEAEGAFRDCCQGFGAAVVGVWGGDPVTYDPLAEPAPLTVPEQQMRELGWHHFASTASLRGGLEQAQQKADGARRQQLAFAGWLTFRAPYQEERQALHTRWEGLGVPTPWPLVANTADQEPIAVPPSEIAQCARLPAQVTAFLEEATRFMRRWYLCRLATWDLPLPQGPLEQIPAGLARHLLGPDQVVSVTPNYYDIPSGQDVRAEIRDQQQRAARDEGVGGDFPLTDLSPRAGRASRWENAFRLWLIERAARQRYGKRRGLSARLTDTIATMLECSDDWIKQLRQIYRPFLLTPHSS